jgi:hypothetical protein
MSKRDDHPRPICTRDKEVAVQQTNLRGRREEGGERRQEYGRSDEVHAGFGGEYHGGGCVRPNTHERRSRCAGEKLETKGRGGRREKADRRKT